MGISLHPDCRRRIIEAAIAGIPGIVAKNGKFLERLSCFVAFYESNNALPQRGEVHDRLAAYVDDYPLIEFFSDILSTELMENKPYLGDKPSTNLCDLEGYSDVAILAHRLVKSLESLPWSYTLSTKLPDELGKQFAALIGSSEMGKDFKLLCPNAATAEFLPLTSADDAKNGRLYPGGLLFGRGEPDTWDQDSCYIQQMIEGYVSQYGDTLPAEDAKRRIRSFLGLGIANNLLEVDYSLRPPAGTFVSSVKTYAHKKHNDRWEIDQKFDLRDDHSRALHTLKFSTINGRLDTFEKQKIWAMSCVGEMKAAFSKQGNSESILLASQWLLDSYIGTDQLQSFVQAMVTLEILLGDKASSDEVGVGELLKNRCAYLIGKDHKQRSDILQDFGTIYKVRSKIVHQGKHRLSADERSLLSKLRWMCRRVIQEELRLLNVSLQPEG